MQFHVTMKVHEAIVLSDDKQLREVLGPQLQKIMASGRVTTSGFLGGIRGLFCIINIDAPEEFYELFGPEVYGTCMLDVQPLIPLDKGGELFQRWAEAGR